MNAKLTLLFLTLALLMNTHAMHSPAQPDGSTSAIPQPADPWTPAQLLAPAGLAARIEKHDAPLILCVGPSAIIKGSVEVGPAHDPANLDKLRTLLAKENTQKEIVIYCGCCPFLHCPNVRPAFALLKTMHFTNARLLDLSHNIRIDWIDHGYPVNP
jgi:thiosulfate/3-mercaptopyruvate sulfurtransferase